MLKLCYVNSESAYNSESAQSIRLSLHNRVLLFHYMYVAQKATLVFQNSSGKTKTVLYTWISVSQKNS